MTSKATDSRPFFADCRGARVAYRKDGQGPCLVLIHGTGGDGDSNWGAMTRLLSDHYTLIRPDYAGSGATVDDGGPLSLDDLASQVLAAVSDAGVDRFHVMGFSLGAAVAVKIAADHPERVESLILLAGFASLDPRLRVQFELWRDLIERDREAMARLALLTGLAPATLSSWEEDTLSRALTDLVDGAHWDGMARQVELDLSLDIKELPPHIQARTLSIGCTHDHMVPPLHARALADVIAGARYREIPTGHLAPMERPDLVAAEVQAFLTET